MLGFALLFALLLDSDRARARGFARIVIFLPYAVPAVISSLLWGFLYLPGVSPAGYLATSLGLTAPNPLAPELDHLRGRQHRDLGWGRLQHDRHLHLAAGHPVRHLRGGPDRRRQRGPDRAAASRSRSSLPALIMTALFSIIATLQVFAEPIDPETADQLVVLDLDAVDEGLPGRVHPRRHLLGRRHLGDHRGRHLRVVVPASCGSCSAEPSDRRTDHDRRLRLIVIGVHEHDHDRLQVRSPPGPGPAQGPGQPTGHGDPHPRRGLLPAAGALGDAPPRPRTAPSCSPPSPCAPATHLWDNVVELTHYRGGLFWRWMANTALYAGVGAVLSTVVSALAGYVLAKYRLPGQESRVQRPVARGAGARSDPGHPAVLPAGQDRADQHLLGSAAAPDHQPVRHLSGPHLRRRRRCPTEVVEAGRVGRAPTSSASSPGCRDADDAARAWSPSFLFQFVAIWNNFMLPYIMLGNDHLFPITVGL